MGALRWVVACSVFACTLPLACGSDGSGPALGVGGADGSSIGGDGPNGGPPRTIGDGCNGDSADSEGSIDSPSQIPLAGLPYVGGLRFRDGPSYYRITGFEVGARYELSINGPIGAETAVFQSGFEGFPACETSSTDGEGGCLVVPQQGSLDVVLKPVFTRDEGDCFTLDVGLDSPAGAFEGAPDNLMILRYGTPDFPHRGIVDHRDSFYSVTQLEPGKLYTLYMTGRDQEVHFSVGEEDPEGGLGNSTCLTGDTMLRGTGEQSCLFEAADESMGVSVWHYTGIESSKYVLSVFEELESEGSIGAPLVLPYGGGLEYEGQVGPRVEVEAWQYSYYQITGLAAGQAYLVGLSDAAGINVAAFSNAAFTTPVTCTNFQATQGCELTSPGTSVYLRVGSYGVHSRRFVLNMHDKPTNQGEYQAPLSLSYPGDFPYAGEASSGSEYLVSGLPTGPLLVSLSLGDGPVSFEAWQADGDTIDCASSPGFPRCTLEASPSGGMRVRVNGPGHFELAIDPAPLLISDFTRDNGGVPIPNADPNGLSDELLVEGSPITSIEAVTVELFIRHGIPAELEAFLVAPDGTEVLVAGKDGGPYEGRYFQDYELESFSGWLRDAAFTVRPTEPLHALEGLDANGTWTLRVVDDENPNIQGNTGELYGWGLTFR